MGSQALFNQGVMLVMEGWLRAREVVTKQAGNRNHVGVVLVCSIAAAGITAAALGVCFLLLFLATCAIVPVVLATACLAGLACLWSSLVCCCAAFCAACFACWLGAGFLAARAAYWTLERLAIYPRPAPAHTTHGQSTDQSTDPTTKPIPTPPPPTHPPTTTSPTPLAPHAGTKHPRPTDATAISTPAPPADRPQQRAPLPTFGRAPPSARTHPTPKRRKARPSKHTYPELLHVYAFSLDASPQQSDSEAGPQPQGDNRTPSAACRTDTPSPARTWGSRDTAPADDDLTAPASTLPATGGAATRSQVLLPQPLLAVPPVPPPTAPPVPPPPPPPTPRMEPATAPSSQDRSSAVAVEPRPAAVAPPKGGVSRVEPSFEDISLPLAPQLPAAWLRALPAQLQLGSGSGGGCGGGVQLALLPHTAAFAGMRQKLE